jgi:Tripartite tricarboxylate transporter TctB family
VKLASQKDFFSGVLFTVVGLAFAVGATSFEVGDAGRMGPGYFPLLLGILLTILGSAITIQSFAKGMPGGDPVGNIAWRPLGFILGANIAFGALLVGLPSIGFPSMGLIVAIFALVIISSMARKGFSIKETLILAALLSAGSFLGFVYLLNLPLPVWPAFFSN